MKQLKIDIVNKLAKKLTKQLNIKSFLKRNNIIYIEHLSPTRKKTPIREA